MYSGTLVFLKFNLKDKKQNVLLQNCAEGEACDEAAAAAAEGNPCRSDLGFTMIMTMMIIRVTYISQIPALFMLSFKKKLSIFSIGILALLIGPESDHWL